MWINLKKIKINFNKSVDKSILIIYTLYIETNKLYGGNNMEHMCEKFGAINEETVWTTSSYGVCFDCYEELTEAELEEIRLIYE